MELTLQTSNREVDVSLETDYCSFVRKRHLCKQGPGNITAHLRHYCIPLYMAKDWYLGHNYIPPYTLSWCLIIRLILDDHC